MRAAGDAIILESALDWGSRRSVLQWLLVSLLLHAMIMWWLQGQLVFPRFEAPALTPPMEITLRRASPETAVLPVEPVLPAPVPAIEPAPLDERPARTEPEAPPVARPDASIPLDLSLPDLDEPEPDLRTDNGATVMQPELRARLQRAPRRSGYAARSERGASGEFQGGSWVEFVRSGNACFQVARANALLAFDYDVWYRVACPD